MQAGFIGIGNMGLPMAEKLLDGGHELLVHDLRDSALAPLSARGARTLPSARAVADAARIVFVSLPTLLARNARECGRPVLVIAISLEALMPITDLTQECCAVHPAPCIETPVLPERAEVLA